MPVSFDEDSEMMNTSETGSPVLAKIARSPSRSIEENMSLSSEERDDAPLAPRQHGKGPRMFTFDIVGSASTQSIEESRDADDEAHADRMEFVRQSEHTVWDSIFASLSYDPATQSCMSYPHSQLSYQKTDEKELSSRSESTSFESKLSTDIVMETIPEEPDDYISSSDRSMEAKMVHATTVVNEEAHSSNKKSLQIETQNLEANMRDVSLKEWWELPDAPSDELEDR